MFKMFWQKPLTLLSLLTALLLVSANSQADTLTASVDRDTLSIQETFTLSLRYSGQSRSGPDLEPLLEDFEIVNTQQSNQMQIINGRMASYTDWHIALAPKRSGQFTIPALTLDDISSQPITIRVEAQNQSAQSTGQSVFVEIETDKDTAYVQEQIIVTIRLFTAVPLSNIELQPLALTDAVVTSLDEKQYQTNLNGRAHAVVETRYAIFPQTSGALVIPSLHYNVTAGSAQRDMWGQMRSNRSSNLLRLRTEEQNLTIKTIPSSFAGKPWLPAANVTLSEHWSASTEQLKIGEPVTRSITINAEGLTAGQIAPIIQPSVDSLTFYPDQAQNEDQNTTKGVVGKRVETLAIVPNRGGAFTLPAVEVEWWDTTSNSVRKATLPEKKVVVEHDIALQSSSSGSLVEDTLEFIPHPPTAEPEAARGGWQQSPVWLLAWAMLASFTTLLFAGLWWRGRNRHAVAPLLSAQASGNAAWADLKRASAEGDLQALKKAVLHWAQLHWERDDLHSLSAIAAQTDNQELKAQLLKLDQVLYSPGGNSEWDSGLLIQQIYACKKEKRQQKRTPESLKSLYR
ncbi:BatD family protein [Cellvibrio polysaccharolyticus]|uniref:Protein BatD n=1 Tax=Cellvibrio polysaccharolyticus TaxID=2082724 RepID=A0A928V1W8_9GAMM|nr:BatD family protein [Cellvibrio polysaccharolyticus]MBE8717265.1 protein BatD [Cellvibrio polysaccharolyticus]